MPVSKQLIDEGRAGQRLDNYLLSLVKGVPKSRIYRAIRGGEVRVNGKRVRPDRRLEVGDEVRVPPFRQGEPKAETLVGDRLQAVLEERIVHEDAELIVLNKPAGLPVHGGSSVSLGVIEALRQMRPQAKFMELVHRLDKGTSGCLLIAKKRATLLQYQELLREGKAIKRYQLLVKGRWQGGARRCDLPLRKNVLSSGERVVRVDHETGKESKTSFRPLKLYKDATLLEARLHTGRTHQIRVHAQSLGYPIAGDDKYGDREFNQQMKHLGLKRMFLHCTQMEEFEAPLDVELRVVLEKL